MFADADVTTILVALGTAVVVSILAPWMKGRIDAKGKDQDALIRKNERKEDNDRLDAQAAAAVVTAAAAASAAVAAQHAAADAVTSAQRLLDHQRIQQAELLASNQLIAQLTEGNTAEIAAIKTNGEKAVHLADGAYTAAKKTERWALAGKLSADRLLVAYRRGTDDPPSAAEYAAIDQGEAMVKALDIEIAAREAALVLAAAEADAAKHFTPPRGTATTGAPAP